RDQNHVFSGMYATGRTGRLDVITLHSEPEHPRGRFVSGNYFSVLQVPALAGRTFSAEEDKVPGADPVIVISHAYWQRQFGGERSAIGRSIKINGAPFTIIGIASEGFSGDLIGQAIDLWIPMMMQPTIMPHSPWLTDRSTGWLLMMGRLSPGVSLEKARAEIQTLGKRSLLDHATPRQRGGLERSLRDEPVMVGPGAQGFSYYRKAFAPALFTLLAAVGLVLLVVCANVANVMLARATGRGREISVRMALGAGRLRLVQQLLTESGLLALAGGALGLLVATWGSSALLKLAGGGKRPIPLDVHLDGRMLAFTALLSLTTAILFGLAPALRGTRVQLATALRAQGRGIASAASGPARLPLGKLLVIAQVALSMLLLVGTAMLVRSMQRLENADVGLARDQLIIATIDGGRSGYAGPKLAALMRDLTERASRVSGVLAVTMSENGIFSGTESGTTLQVEGYTAHADSDTAIAYDDVGPNYFHALGAHLLLGRDFEPRDNETGPKVAIINETMSRYFFPKGGAVGRHITSDSAVTFEIVGIVADVKAEGVRDKPVRRAYFPAVQMRQLPSQFNMEFRTTGDPARSVVPIKKALLSVDPSLVVLSIDPLPDLIRESISQDRLVAQVVTFFSALALALAALGLYGVMAYATLRRTSEFGLRLALGAQPADVSRMVLREAMMLVAGGIVVGIPVALGAMRLMRTQLFGVELIDPPSIIVALLTLAASAALAGWLPARRAARVGPLEALRTD
ncbi:MAG: ABC transporter permease, partial [Gemmatimonadota bacterium]|nr:ABC transporter permease [Gemmatimonadota bacterium]